MNRSIWTLSLVLALVWATGALDVIHHLGEGHDEFAGVAAEAPTGASIGDPEVAESDVCAWCVALSGKCCHHRTPPPPEVRSATADAPLDPFNPPTPATSAPHNRGPPSLG